MSQEVEVVRLSDFEKRVRPFSNIIPRRRNGSGEPIPRQFVSTKPLITLDAEALTQTAAMYATDPVEGRKRLPWLKAMNAIAASENAINLRQEFEHKMVKENAEVQARISELEPLLKESNEELQRLSAELASVAASIGLKVTDEGVASMLAGEGDISLEEIAGKYSLYPPEENPSWAYRTGYKLLAGIGGGTVFGISLGLLTGKLELVSLSDEWPMLILWSLVGAMVMTLVGASLYPLARDLGERFYRLGRRFPWLANLQAIFTLVFLIGLTFAVIRIESKVEQLGLFKAIGEQSSLAGFRVAQTDIFWVSLMLVIPTVCSYIVLGLIEGARLANLAHLKALSRHRLEELYASPTYTSACYLQSQVQFTQDTKSKLENEMQALKNCLRYEFSTEEKERLEDMEMDAATASWDVGASLFETNPVQYSYQPTTRRSFLHRLIEKFMFKSNSRSFHCKDDAGAET